MAVFEYKTFSGAFICSLKNFYSVSYCALWSKWLKQVMNLYILAFQDYNFNYYSSFAQR